MDQIPLKDMPGYFMAWGGEAEDSAKAQDGVGQLDPRVLRAYGADRDRSVQHHAPTVDHLVDVPLALIGVTWGLLVAGQPFGFMALLGFMSLSGMLIKNAIVLIDEISIQRKTKEAFQAVVDSGVSRMRPVSMAALTTILGMVPLLLDAFFVSMAVTIMAGLLVATVLTLIVVPTLYVMFYRVPNP